MLRVLLLLVGAVLTAALQIAWRYAFVFWIATLVSGHFTLAVQSAQQESREAQQENLPAEREVQIPKVVTVGISHLDLDHHELDARSMGLTYTYSPCDVAIFSLLTGLLLLLASAGLRSYISRVLFVLLLDFLVAVALLMATPNWNHHPWRFLLVSAGFQLVSWLLAALVLGAFVRPPRLLTAPFPVDPLNPGSRPVTPTAHDPTGFFIKHERDN